MNGRRFRWIGLTAVVLLAISSVVAWHCLAEWDLPTESAPVGRLPKIHPDYADIVIPPNIAPLNFVLDEPGVEFRVRIRGTKSKDLKEIIVGSRKPSIVIPPKRWRQLLEQNRGERIEFEVYAKDDAGGWSRFSTFGGGVAQDTIDSHVVYRFLGPVCSLYRNMGLYQRNLENFEETPLLANNESFDGCVNCHSFSSNRPGLFALQVRPGMNKKTFKGGMFLIRGDQITELKTQSKAAPNRPSYIAWHPSGSVIAFSMTKTRQIFHGAGDEMREGYDTSSHLAIVNIGTGEVSTSPGIADPVMQESFPCWSADGKTLYFCRAKTLWNNKTPPRIEELKTVMYDLMRVNYDIGKNEFGLPETVLTAAETGLSIGEPKVSPDGRFLLFCMADHGNFYPFQASSDLYLLDLESGKYRRLDCNSDCSDAWHSWSSNSRWIVFSSRRDVSLLSRLYFSYIDPQGNASKPFLLPQEEPSDYDSSLKVYNVPELVAGPVAISQRKLLQAIRATGDEADDSPIMPPNVADGNPRK